MFHKKQTKVALHKHNFSPAIHSPGVLPNNKKCSMQKIKFGAKLICSIKTNIITNFFPTFLRNSVKCVVSRAVSDALSGALKVARQTCKHLRAMTVKTHSQMIPINEGKNEYIALKVKG